MMTKNKLINNTLYELLWEVVGNKTEEVKNLTIMLKDINYLDDKENLIAKITNCEIHTSDDFNIINSYEKDDYIVIDCEMDFIMQTFIGKEYIWRITGVTECKICIPCIDGYNWKLIENAANKNDLLKHKDIVSFIDINFEWVECGFI